MKNLFKKAALPLLASFIMMLVVGGYFVYGSTLDLNDPDSIKNHQGNSSVDIDNGNSTPPPQGGEVSVHGASSKQEVLENGCIRSGNTVGCVQNVNPTPTPSQGESSQNNDPNSTSNQCKQVCISYQTVCN